MCNKLKKNHLFFRIFEGLYLFLKEWKLFNSFDYKIFIDCNPEVAFNSLA